ncbi:MAG: hypothetical protein RBR68_14540 [Tenuifilaceae bacterium]|nr:hypothetical protein [Tenuifilaceae bacterium]
MSIVSSGMKFMHQSGLNSYINISMGLDAAHEFSNSAMTVGEGVWNEDPNTFTQAGAQFGYGAGSVASLAAFGAMSAGFAARNRFNPYHSFEGNVYKESFFRGKLYNINSPGVNIEKELASKIKGSGTRGFMAKGSFKAMSKGLGRFIGIGGTVAAIGALIVPPMLFSAAGKVADSAWQSSIAAKQIKYDNRFFNTQEQEMSAYQTLGASMDAYHSKMISCSRIYRHGG